MSSDIEAGVRSAISQMSLQHGLDVPADDATPFRLAGWSSFQMVELIFTLEACCGVEIDDSEINPANFETTAAVLATLGRLRTGSAVAAMNLA